MIGSWFLWMVAAYLITAAGDVFIKKENVLIGAIIYASSAPLWVQVLRQKDLSNVVVASAVIGNAIVLIAARIFLDERLGPWQFFGIALGLAAVIMMEM